jgi:hypothetical protein
MKRLLTLIVAAGAVCLAAGMGWGDTIYGINAHVPSTQALDLAAAAGIEWVRLDFNWFTLEPARGSYNWGYMDAVVNAARARGLQIFATLAYTPAWANGTGNIADPPTNPADWSDFVYATVRRYRGAIKHWGMWNEPNLDGFWTGEAWQYREWILKPGHDAATSADPSCLVLGPELASLSSGDYPGWLEEITKAGGGDYIDIVTHHVYKGDTGWDTFDYLDEGAFHWPWDDPPLQDALSDVGLDGKPVWLTETGWTTADGKDSVSEADQAEYYRQLLWGVTERASWLQKVFPYELIDDPTPGVPKWGIIRADYSPKPAYYAYQEFVDAPANPGGENGCGAANRPDAGLNFVLLLTAPLCAWIGRMRRRAKGG